MTTEQLGRRNPPFTICRRPNSQPPFCSGRPNHPNPNPVQKGVTIQHNGDPPSLPRWPSEGAYQKEIFVCINKCAHRTRPIDFHSLCGIAGRGSCCGTCKDIHHATSEGTFWTLPSLELGEPCGLHTHKRGAKKKWSICRPF